MVKKNKKENNNNNNDDKNDDDDSNNNNREQKQKQNKKTWKSIGCTILFFYGEGINWDRLIMNKHFPSLFYALPANPPPPTPNIWKQNLKCSLWWADHGIRRNRTSGQSRRRAQGPKVLIQRPGPSKAR